MGHGGGVGAVIHCHTVGWGGAALSGVTFRVLYRRFSRECLPQWPAWLGRPLQGCLQLLQWCWTGGCSLHPIAQLGLAALRSSDFEL